MSNEREIGQGVSWALGVCNGCANVHITLEWAEESLDMSVDVDSAEWIINSLQDCIHRAKALGRRNW